MNSMVQLVTCYSRSGPEAFADSELDRGGVVEGGGSVFYTCDTQIPWVYTV